MPVLFRIDRLRVFAALFATAVLACAGMTAHAQQQEQPRRQQTQPQKPAAKTKPPAAVPAKPATAPAAAKAETLPPSQVGIGTYARQAFMVDPQTSSVMLFKDAEQPMPPSSIPASG